MEQSGLAVLGLPWCVRRRELRLPSSLGACPWSVLSGSRGVRSSLSRDLAIRAHTGAQPWLFAFAGSVSCARRMDGSAHQNVQVQLGSVLMHGAVRNVRSCLYRDVAAFCFSLWFGKKNTQPRKLVLLPLWAVKLWSWWQLNIQLPHPVCKSELGGCALVALLPDQRCGTCTLLETSQTQKISSERASYATKSWPGKMA